MKDLIEALTIILKYGECKHGIAAEHDVLYVGSAVDSSEFSEEDLARLKELHFHPDTENGGFYHFT